MKLKTLRTTGPLLIICAAILWALDGILRRNLYSLPPITIILVEHLIGLVILLPFSWQLLVKEKIGKREWWLLLLIAILSGLLGTLWFTTALLKVHFISFSVVFLLQKLQPLFAIGSARIFLKEKISRGYVKWAVLAIIAAYFIMFKDGVVNIKTGEGTIIAALYALGAAFAWGTSTTFSKMLLGKVHPTVSTFYRFLFTSIIACVLVFSLGYIGTLAEVTIPQLWLFVIIALSTGMVALMIYYRGLVRTPVHISTILELTFPFIAILIDMKLYHSTLAFSQWIAVFVLVYSIYRVVQLQNGISK